MKGLTSTIVEAGRYTSVYMTTFNVGSITGSYDATNEVLIKGWGN